jgi:cysteinyl-tRNA synthetase
MRRWGRGLASTAGARAMGAAVMAVAVALGSVGCTGDSAAWNQPPTADASGSEPSAGPTATSAGPTATAAAGSVGQPPGGQLPGTAGITSWAYQLQGYEGNGLTALVRSPHRLVVVDLARDAKSDWFRPDEIAALHAAGKRALAYFEIGSIEDFRPEYPALRRDAGDLVLNRWEDWPNEYFVRYWDGRWWDRVIRPRIDQALRAGFDGVYLDTPLAYEELDLALVPGQTRDKLARAMTDLIVRISAYAKAHRSNFWIFPQNSPELRLYAGYTQAIDGIGMEELFFLATDQACTQQWCEENLDHTRALRDAGKLVLAVDYASVAANVRVACERYRTERFVGYVTDRELDRIAAPCG